MEVGWGGGTPPNAERSTLCCVLQPQAAQHSTVCFVPCQAPAGRGLAGRPGAGQPAGADLNTRRLRVFCPRRPEARYLWAASPNHINL